MKQTSNKLFDYPGHIDCRNSSLTLDKLEWERKLSVKLKASENPLPAAPTGVQKRFNSNSNYLVKVIND